MFGAFKSARKKPIVRYNMATKKSSGGKVVIESTPKKTLQGLGKNTKYAATSRNKARKPYRGQGK